jgi:hypothetical protein
MKSLQSYHEQRKQGSAHKHRYDWPLHRVVAFLDHGEDWKASRRSAPAMAAALALHVSSLHQSADLHG